MTLAAATADLRAGAADDRDFHLFRVTTGFNVTEDLRQSLAASVPELRRVVGAIATPIALLLDKFISSPQGPNGAPTYTID